MFQTQGTCEHETQYKDFIINEYFKHKEHMTIKNNTKISSFLLTVRNEFFQKDCILFAPVAAKIFQCTIDAQHCATIFIVIFVIIVSSSSSSSSSLLTSTFSWETLSIENLEKR